MLAVASFTFGTYTVDTTRSVVTFTYIVEFKSGRIQTFSDKISLPDVASALWNTVPATVIEPTLQALLIMLGINYWCAFPTSTILIQGFTLSREQAMFWNSLYLNGLGEYFYTMQMDFYELINFPFDVETSAPIATRFTRPKRALLLNGAGKDSILSAELLKAENKPFDLFTFEPSPAHTRTATRIGAKTITVTRRRDPWLDIYMTLQRTSSAYPSVSTYTFIATLLAELLGYSEIIFSNERSADFGNLTYKGLSVNHQWCKSTEAEKMINNYIQTFITPDISTKSLLREYSEIEIVERFVQYPQYFNSVTSCNSYFWLPRVVQRMQRKAYWCGRCPKCVFLFACYSAYLPKKEVVQMFGANLYSHKRLLPLFKRILGTEGFKPLDCVGEPDEMILAMHYASLSKEYKTDTAMVQFEKLFPSSYDFKSLAKKVFRS